MSEYWNPMVPELLVTNFNKSLDFYTNILGFSIRIRRELPDFVYLEKGHIQLMLEQEHEKAWITGELEYPLGRGINLQMEIPDLTDMLVSLKGADITFYRELHESWYDIGEKLSGEKEFVIQDPDGYLLRFTQHLGEKPKV
ncbi:MAG: catechol 2,3-dioxygenase-like lactoylglutathione lyase family enzyme [Moritella sp.]|jgi:catechol 2,3-dioxygenase-like lactoylglutathione lyase family enzyme